MSARTLALLVSVPALLCAAIGLTHPPTLNAASADHWRNMHIVLIPIFPLIGLAPWLIARRAGVAWSRAGAVFGYGFATFYTSLDLLAGVAGGALVAHAVAATILWAAPWAAFLWTRADLYRGKCGLRLGVHDCGLAEFLWAQMQWLRLGMLLDAMLLIGVLAVIFRSRLSTGTNSGALGLRR